ncbi:metastasis suppressor protein 1 isoform X3 [Hippocampus comes]|uniref:metastasis suppressor protein 1 isoform X3 n=1 Tax=Hippocampus comes TaxID=109280 RepID=UPI00094E9063|nr:PREDICTED: metastasis suppressor protein 1 isoform X3 [Hippocampus comes]
MESMERECSALGGLFQNVIADLKGSYPVWEDFVSKASKLQSQLRATVVAVAAFLDAFQKVADMASGSRGATRDIGSALTRMCMRHRSIEAKLRQFSTLFVDCLINPLQEQMEEWKRVANTLDKDHAKEYKKARQEIKKRSSDTLKLQKKAKKADVFGRGDIRPQLDNAKQEVSDKYLLLEEAEKQALRRALVEERSRFCCVVAMLRPVVEEEMSMLGEISHLQTLTDDLKTLTMDPHKLPASSEQVIVDLKASECSWSYQTPPSSPSTTVSRKSSMCSSLNSVTSSDSRSSGSHCHSPASHFRYRASSSSALPQRAPARLSSVSSHDSGFISQDAPQSKSPSPMPPDPLQDWVKPLFNAPRRVKERRETIEPPKEELHVGKGSPPVTSSKDDREAHVELAKALAHSLHLDFHGSSRDSLHGSSGYSSQTNTPCCSEDAGPTQDCDFFSMGADHEGDDVNISPGASQPSDPSRSCRPWFGSKRPPSARVAPSPSTVVPPGVATIRRTPSSKPNLRRPSAGLPLGPIPIKPPTVPVKTPTVPDHHGFPGARTSKDGRTPQTPVSPPSTLLSPGSSGTFSPRLDPGQLLEETEHGDGVGDFLAAIRRGVHLKRTTTNDRSAPRIH